MRKICVYGKGGIGKSTTVANVAAALAKKGLKVAVVGCDPKADTTRCLVGKRIPTVLQQIENGGEVCVAGYLGIQCIESGGPEPGTGCAGRGIAAALSEIRGRCFLDDMDVVLYDVLGDVVCGGFSMPLRDGIADDVYLVTTADFMSVYAANNICRGIEKYAEENEIRLSGIIYNGRSGCDNPEQVMRFAQAVGTEVIGTLSMSELVSQAERKRKTVIETAPDSQIGREFAQIAEQFWKGGKRCIPKPLSDEELENLWGWE